MFYLLDFVFVLKMWKSVFDVNWIPILESQIFVKFCYLNVNRKERTFVVYTHKLDN